MSHPKSNIRAMPLAPIPETSQIHFVPPPPQPLAPTAPSAFTHSDVMAVYPQPMLGGMPAQFWWTPDHAACAFSTQEGRLPKRQLEQPYPAPILRTNLNHDVHKKAFQLARQFPDLASGIKPVENWYHLYRYWDAVDLWTEGAGFCYQVLNRIAEVNKELDDAFFFAIDETAKEWITRNEELVINNPQIGNLTDLFDELDRANFTGMSRNEIAILNIRLNHHRHLLLAHVQEFRRHAAQHPRIVEYGPGPAGMIGPYPTSMYPVPPPNYPHGAPMMDPQRVPFPLTTSPKAPHQTYNQFVESQRNIASRFGPRVAPFNHRNENNRLMEARPRGWSNDTARNGRGGKPNNQWNNRNGRPYVPATPQSSPPRHMGSGEPIYVMMSQNPSPGNVQLPISTTRHTQRAVSDSPSPGGTFEAVHVTPLGRRASANDVGSRPYIPENTISTPIQATRSDKSTPRGTVSNDARVLEAMEKQAGLSVEPPLSQTQAIQNPPLAQAPAVQYNIELIESVGSAGPISTYFYATPPRRLSYDDQNIRSVFVGGSSYELFLNHALKEFMSQCGEVDNICYLTDRGHAFVAFMQESSVQLAVLRLNGQVFGRVPLEINIPRGRTRGDSHSSQRSHTSNRTITGPRENQQGPHVSRYNQHARNFSRNSVDDVPHHVRNFSRQSNDAMVSPPCIEGRLMSSASEVIQHTAAFNRMGPLMPLESIENTYGPNQQNKPNHVYRRNGDAFSQAGQHNGKENSSMKYEKSPMTPSRKSSFSSQAGGQGSKRKQNRRAVSRQNSSTSTATRPTPAGTPIKSRSAVNLIGHIQDDTSAANYDKDQNATSMVPVETRAHFGASEDINALKPKLKSKRYGKKKKNAVNNEGEHAIAGGNSKNHNTSFNSESSLDNLEVASPVGTESSMGFRSNSTSFSTLPSRKPSVVSSVTTPPMSEASEENDNFVPKAMVSPKTPEVKEDSVTPKPSQQQFSSNESDIVAKQRSASGETQPKKESVVSATNVASSSLRKVDAKVAESDIEAAESPEAKIHIDDQLEFPALGPIKSPLSAIADGKRPAAIATSQRPPVIGSLGERVVSGKNLVKPAVPVIAVPRSYMQRQASQPAEMFTKTKIDLTGLTKDGLGSSTWPFVKSVRPL